MKTRHIPKGMVAVAILLLGSLNSCESLVGDKSQGRIVIHFSEKQYASTKASWNELPDTNDFLLTVTDKEGELVYEGTYGNSPEELLVDPGTYNVSARSIDFRKPAFSAPEYGDDQCVVVSSGGVTDVTLICTQQNSGIKLRVSEDFKLAYPYGELYVGSEDGKLQYDYDESRIAYFNPGNVTVTLEESDKEYPLFTRSLAAREVLSVGLSAPEGRKQNSDGSISIVIDTTRNWTNYDYTVGSENSGGGSDVDNAVDVATARTMAGAEDVWVYGYIVGSFKSTSNIVFEEPFPSATNMAIAGKSSTTNKDSCLSVELKKGTLRDELNLLDHPENKGAKVFLKGDIYEAYYGIPGIKNITDYVIE